jgi:hypothetical protein
MAIRNQSIRVRTVLASSLLIALGYLCISTPIEVKTRTWREWPQPPKPLPAGLIKCASVTEASPCWPDPAMEELYPPAVPMAPPVVRPLVRPPDLPLR